MQVTHDLGVGGLPRVVETLCRAIDPEQFDVSVLCLNDGGPLADRLQSQGYTVHLPPADRPHPDYFAFRRVAAVMRQAQVDIVHTHNTQPFVDGGLASVLAGVPLLVHTDHARDFPDKLRYMVAEHVLSWRAYRVVGVSTHTTENLRRYEKIASRKLVTIPNGIEAAPFVHPIDPVEVRARVGLSPTDTMLLLGARLDEQKGMPFLIDAVAALAGRVRDLHLVIAGEGPLRDALIQQAAARGVGDRVHFPGVRLDMPDLLRAADLFVMSSLWEGLPMVILEALAAGCPIVSTEVGGVPTAVQHDRTGVLVPPRDPAALAHAIESLLQDAPRRARYAAAGRALFHERFSADAMARRYEAIYRREPQ